MWNLPNLEPLFYLSLAAVAVVGVQLLLGLCFGAYWLVTHVSIGFVN